MKLHIERDRVLTIGALHLSFAGSSSGADRLLALPVPSPPPHPSVSPAPEEFLNILRSFSEMSVLSKLNDSNFACSWIPLDAIVSVSFLEDSCLLLLPLLIYVLFFPVQPRIPIWTYLHRPGLFLYSLSLFTEGPIADKTTSRKGA